MFKRWALAVGSKSGTVYQIVEAPDGGVPDMLPPCSNQDLPVWIAVVEASALEAARKTKNLLATLLALSISALILLSLASCSKARSEIAHDQTKLFVIDNCTVYRFHDIGDFHYFWDCKP